MTEEGAATPVAAGRSGRELLGKMVATSAVGVEVVWITMTEEEIFVEKRGRKKRGTVTCGEVAG